MIQIIPAILATTDEEYQQAIEKINITEALIGATVHIDVADGIFVASKTAYWAAIEKYPLNLEKEAHLMVAEPTGWVTRLSLFDFKRVIFHLGVGKEDHIIEMIKQRHIEVGLALNPEQGVEELTPYLNKLDEVLIMSVHPGKQGQEFLPDTLEKIKQLTSFRIEKGLDFKIGVDGGITAENIKSVIEAGADYIVIGSHLLEGDINENLETIWAAIR